MTEKRKGQEGAKFPFLPFPCPGPPDTRMSSSWGKIVISYVIIKNTVFLQTTHTLKYLKHSRYTKHSRYSKHGTQTHVKLPGVVISVGVTDRNGNLAPAGPLFDKLGHVRSSVSR